MHRWTDLISVQWTNERTSFHHWLSGRPNDDDASGRTWAYFFIVTTASWWWWQPVCERSRLTVSSRCLSIVGREKDGRLSLLLLLFPVFRPWKKKANARWLSETPLTLSLVRFPRVFKSHGEPAAGSVRALKAEWVRADPQSIVNDSVNITPNEMWESEKERESGDHFHRHSALHHHHGRVMDVRVDTVKATFSGLPSRRSHPVVTCDVL